MPPACGAGRCGRLQAGATTARSVRNRVRVEADARPRPPRAAPVTQRDGRRHVGLAWHDPDRGRNDRPRTGAPPRRRCHAEALAVAGLSSAALSQLDLVSGRGTPAASALLAKRPSYSDGSGGTPAPARCGRRPGGATRLGPTGSTARLRRRLRRTRDHAVVQAARQNVSKSARCAGPPSSPSPRRGSTAVIRKRCQQLVRGMRVVQGRDHRLNDRRGAVEGARVRPVFERMQRWNVPVTRTAVRPRTGRDARAWRHWQCSRKREIRRGGVRRVTAQHQQ